MPHTCVRCDREYEEDLPDMEVGCECGSKVFMFRRPAVESPAPVAQRGGKFFGWFGKQRSVPADAPVDVIADGKYSIDLREALNLDSEE